MSAPDADPKGADPKAKNLRVEIDEAVAIVTVDRPKALNALNSATLDELLDAFNALAADPAVRAIVLTGAGKSFVAGADIAEMVDMSAAEAQAFSARGQRLMLAIQSCPRPVIAAINGSALGGGCGLAMACDILYASDKARFGQPEVNLGVIPGFGGTQRLTRLVGRAMASELILTGRLINAEEALRIGLVCHVFPADALMDAALKAAREIAAKGPQAIAAAKAAIQAGADVPIERACERETLAFANSFATDDQTEGMRAFLDKRPPNFTGR